MPMQFVRALSRFILCSCMLILLLPYPLEAASDQTLVISDVAAQQSNSTSVDITAKSTEENPERLSVRGIFFTDLDNTLDAPFTNHGDIDITANSAHGDVRIRGVQSDSMSVEDGDPVDKTVQYDFENHGTISVTGIMGSDDTPTQGDSMSVRGLTFDKNITNYSDITVTTKTFRIEDSSVSGTLEHETDARGISGGATQITNYGDITINSSGGDVTAASTDARSIVNIHSISGEGSVTNYGTINTYGKGGSVTNDTNAETADTIVRGISAHSSVSNYGDITVTAVGGTVTTVGGSTNKNTTTRTLGISAGGDVRNTGTISLTTVAAIKGTSSDDATATGILMTQPSGNTSSPTDPDILYSKGLIITSVKDPEGYSGGTHTTRQVRIDPDSNNQYVSITGYALQFSDQASLNTTYADTIVYEDSAGTTGNTSNVTFSNAMLYAYVGEGFTGTDTLTVPKLVKDSTAVAQFADITSMHPDVSATLATNGTAQSVTLVYTPKTSSPLLEARASNHVQLQNHAVVTNAITRTIFAAPSATADAGVAGNTASMYAANGDLTVPILTTQRDKRTWFIQPTYSYSEDTSSSGYNADTYGFTLGFTYKLFEKAYLGVHGGWTRSEVDFTGTTMNSDDLINTYFIGTNAAWLIDDHWLFTGLSTFFYGDNDYTSSSPTLSQQATYDSLTIRTDLRFGYLFRCATQRLLPEIGITHTWLHRGEFNTAASDGMDTTYGTLDNHEIYGKLNLRWYNEFKLSDTWQCTPLLGVGVTQILTDGQLTASQSLASASQLITDEEDDTTITPEANVTFSNGVYYIIAGYNGGYSSNTNNTQFWLQLGVTF
ncbi:MAG: autotransporter outer membrane beta-barrel domain-containing protein [Desulfovibrionales bacterium]|nr:autotransporter outer membrane beta-barrel domain-containing protein [Desulfovibrionales bacterium]